eukprot:6844846-Prymnesium_polylepis.1
MLPSTSELASSISNAMRVEGELKKLTELRQLGADIRASEATRKRHALVSSDSHALSSRVVAEVVAGAIVKEGVAPAGGENQADLRELVLQQSRALQLLSEQ